jgi:hypothetical protein
MSYYHQRKKYKGLIDHIDRLDEKDLSLSKGNNIVVKLSDLSDGETELVLGWEKEKITHLKIKPNKIIREMLELDLTKEELKNRINNELRPVFMDCNIKLPELRF